jgi:hypothetical protein
MTAIPALVVEMEMSTAILDPDGFNITDPDGFNIEDPSGWGDVTADIRTAVPISYSLGNTGHTLQDRMGDVGALTLAFDNSIGNSVGMAGYYSPDSGNCRDGFVQDASLRITITASAIAYYQWQGYITNITPDAGIYERQLTMVAAVSWFRYLEETKFEAVAVQVNKRDNELLTTLFALLPVPPEATDFDTGDDQYTYAFHDEQSGQSSIARLCQKLMVSGLGKLYERGGTTTAQTIKYISRTGALLTTTPVATLSDTMTDLKVTRDDTSRVKKVVIVPYPAQVDTSNVVMWQLNKSIAISAGASVVFTMRLRDPSGRATGVANFSTLAPVADTDYKFSSVDGSGNDKNANITFAYAAGADAIDVTATNTSGTTGYLWLFTPRGKLIYLYEPVPVVKLTGQARGVVLQLDMWYQDDPLVALDIATIVAAWYSVPQSNISEVTFIANKSDALMLAALQVQPGDLVQITETQTAINESFFVNGKRTVITAGGPGGPNIKVTWALTPANQLLDVFILDQSALDVDALGA